MSITRPAFDEALSQFRSFLRKEGVADRLLWITKDRVSGHRTSVWIFRPQELLSDSGHREFYETLRTTKVSIRIDTLCEFSDATVAYVQDHGGEGGHLNYGIDRTPRRIKVVSSRIWWRIITLYCRISGESPLLRGIQVQEANQTPEPMPPKRHGSS